MGAKRAGIMAKWVAQGYEGQLEPARNARNYRVGVPSHHARPLRLWSGPLTVTARSWPGFPGCAYLLIAGGHSGDLQPPDTDTVNQWLATLRDAGYSHVRTGAVGPDIARRLTESGFAVAQDLALLSVDLTAGTPVVNTGQGIRVVRRGPGRRGVLAGVLDVDSTAFGPGWALDMDSLEEAIAATQRSRTWTARDDSGRVTGFVLAGVTGPTGFVQRIAVSPGHRRTGLAASLLGRAHDWMSARGCTTAVVNTETTNDAALALYQRFGYRAMPYGLQVLERSLTTGVAR
mgnify:FL=1